MSERHIVYVSEVTPQSANLFISLLIGLGQQGTTKLVVAMNCPGGSVSSGVSIYNAMLAMPYEISSHNIGNVDSIANIIFLAGKERYACTASTFMFHGIGFN